MESIYIQWRGGELGTAEKRWRVYTVERRRIRNCGEEMESIYTQWRGGE